METTTKIIKANSWLQNKIAKFRKQPIIKQHGIFIKKTWTDQNNETHIELYFENRLIKSKIYDNNNNLSYYRKYDSNNRMVIERSFYKNSNYSEHKLILNEHTAVIQQYSFDENIKKYLHSEEIFKIKGDFFVPYFYERYGGYSTSTISWKKNSKNNCNYYLRSRKERYGEGSEISYGTYHYDSERFKLLNIHCNFDTQNKMIHCHRINEVRKNSKGEATSSYSKKSKKDEEVLLKDGVYENKLEFFTIKNSKKYGRCIKYYSNGNIQESGLFIDGKKYGIYRTFYGNGQLEISAEYKNDVLHGRYQEFYENGKVFKDILYKNGKI